MESIWDIHTHILPGIDDGAKNWDIALQMLQTSWETGVRTVIATPHYLPWHEPVKPETVLSLCREAADRCDRELGIGMQILPGEELYYHDGLTEDLLQGRALTLAGSHTVLVEFSEQVPWSELKSALVRLRRSGYHPILAHAERYACLRKDERFQEIRSSGVLIQSNAQEVQGGLFDNMARWVRRQYKAHAIDFTASDMHNLESRPPLSARQINWFLKSAGEEYTGELFGGNIRARIDKEDL